MPFDWQAKLSSTMVPAAAARVRPPPPTMPPAAISFARVVTPPLPTASPVVNFAQALTASTRAASNEILPQPTIRGETVGIKITQGIYERGMDVCKSNLRGRLVLNKGDKPYATKEIAEDLEDNMCLAHDAFRKRVLRIFLYFRDG